MLDILKKEKKLYFKSAKRFIHCWLTNEHEYVIWKYVKLLRKEEKSRGLLKYYYSRRKNKLGVKLGFTIPAGVFSEGLHIYHYGNIVVNGYSKIGRNCKLHGDNCIGNNGITSDAPIIGDNVDIGFGAIVIGKVKIANNVKIGGGCVVVKDILEEGSTYVGIPARRV